MPKTTEKSATPKAEAEAKVASEPTLDAEGFPLTKSGERDKRYQVPPSERETATKERKSPGITRRETLETLFADRKLEYVREGFDASGVKSATGAHLKRYFVLKDVGTGEEIICGRGEMVKYAGIQPPAKPRGRKRAEGEFEGAFPQDGDAEAEETENTEPQDLGFVDEE